MQYPPLQQDAVCDVLVVGGGIVGLSIAYNLAKVCVGVTWLPAAGSWRCTVLCWICGRSVCVWGGGIPYIPLPQSRHASVRG